jgi:hypothetical protein
MRCLRSLVKFSALSILLFCVASVPTRSQPSNPRTLHQQSNQSVLTDQERAIKITIASVGPMLGLPTDRYRVGEQIPITIVMTNTSSVAADVSVSSDFYQDRPRLTKNGQVVPYSKWQSEMLWNARKTRLVCTRICRKR